MQFWLNCIRYSKSIEMRTAVFFLLSFLLFASCESSKKELSRKGFPSAIAPAEGEKQAKGFVFHDENENLQMDEGEKGISGVVVSNGIDVVVTDNNGYYGLPVTDDAALFVVKPAEWMTPVNEDNLPQFYYLHKPEGSPTDFRYKGVAPTGPLPDEVNFPLYPDKTENEFKIVVFGDPQPYNIRQVDYLAEDVVRELIGRKDLEFGVTMGDIVGDDLDLFSPLNQVVSEIGIPWHNLFGNHDMNFDASSDKLADETYERVYGPATYAFEYGNVHFIVLDDVIHKNVGGEVSYTGGLRPDQLEFVANYLKTVPKEKLVVLTMHIPLALHGDHFRKSDQKRLFKLLEPFPHTLSISAHSHIQHNEFYHKDSSGWKREEPHHHFNVGTTSGSWWTGIFGETNIPHTMMRDGTPNGYAFVTFKGSEYTIDWKVAGSSKDHQMNIHVPRGIVKGSPDTTLLTVNFFKGSTQSKVEYRVKGKTEWQTMQQVHKIDPYYAKLVQRWKNFQKIGLKEQWKNDPRFNNEEFPGAAVPRPRPSTHLWEANLGTDWPAGRHTIEVRATDRYGKTFIDYQTMRVAEK